MCGIAGLVRFDDTQASEELVCAMTRVIAHRGPDGEGIHILPRVGLGHRRLAIIDLSPAGHQPMSNEDGTVWITYNGEIYNFQEIRQELERCGHQFRSDTDTEAVIHAYEEWGVDCLARFNGMFAFALWDGKQQKLWLVRDRLGVKPLFYSHQSDGLLFGSEIKAILCSPDIDRSIDYEALTYFLAFNWIPAPYTLFNQVRQVLPGHYLLINVGTGCVDDIQYWDVIYEETEDRGEQAYIEEFTALLEDAIRLRLVSDVPFGAFLSGGLDSSTVAYWMSKNLGQPVKSFSIGFDEPTFDELAYARQTAEAIGAEHHEFVVTADSAAVLPKIVWHSEEPTADSSMVAVYYLSQLAREHVTMVLSGDGADEILAGYETHQAYTAHRLYSYLPRWLRHELIHPIVNKVPVSYSKVSLDAKLRRFVNSADNPSEDAHALWRIIFDAASRESLLRPVQSKPGAGIDVLDIYRAAFGQTSARHPLNRLLYVDTRVYLPNDMLVKVDRMSMAHGLEAREPFLDHRLVSFAAKVPARWKLKSFRHKKHLLKATMRSRLPARVVYRKKAGFNVPNARWIQEDLKPFVMDHLSPQRLHDMGLLDPPVVARVLREHFDGRSDNSHQIWCLLTLVLWWDTFLRKPGECV